MRYSSVAMVWASALLLIGVPVGAQSDAQYRQVADKVVGQLLSVKPGDVVLVFADPTHLALVDEVATSVSMSGAFPIVSMGDNHMNRLYWERVPAKYDSLPPKSGLELLKIANETIAIDFPFDPSVTQGVPPSRLAAVARAGNAATVYTIKHGIPGISIGNGILPSALTANQFGVSQSVLSTLFWSGLNADYGQIRRDATALASTVGASKTVRITSPNGTAISFSVVAHPAEINDGIVSAADRARGGAAVQKQLPAGDVYFIPKAGTANGKLVLGDTRVNGTLVSAMTMQVAGGKVTSMSATSGEAVVDKLYAAGGPGRDVFSFVDFGTNRSMHVPAGQWGGGPSMAAGFVSIGIGNNLVFGGSDSSPFFFLSNVPSATVTVDGKALITSGALAMGT